MAIALLVALATIVFFICLWLYHNIDKATGGKGSPCFGTFFDDYTPRINFVDAEADKKKSKKKKAKRKNKKDSKKKKRSGSQKVKKSSESKSTASSDVSRSDTSVPSTKSRV